MQKILVVLALAVLAGCQMHGEKASLASGRIGCAPQQITISEDSMTFNTASWKASCQGRTFYCVRRAYEDTTCTAALAPPPASSLPVSPQPVQGLAPQNGLTKQERVQQLQGLGLPYEEYQRRYREIMAE